MGSVQIVAACPPEPDTNEPADRPFMLGNDGRIGRDQFEIALGISCCTAMPSHGGEIQRMQMTPVTTDSLSDRKLGSSLTVGCSTRLFPLPLIPSLKISDDNRAQWVHGARSRIFACAWGLQAKHVGTKIFCGMDHHVQIPIAITTADREIRISNAKRPCPETGNRTPSRHMRYGRTKPFNQSTIPMTGRQVKHGH